MKIEIVMPKRLLDHQQIEGVELFEMVHVRKCVCGIGVAAQCDLRPAFANPLEDLYVPARLTLQLYALISSSDFGGDLLFELLGRILNADGDAAGNLFSRPAE